MTVTLGQSGICSNDEVIPDISIGKCWGRYWTDNSLAERFGDRLEYQHNYPPYFPQAASNPQTPWCYPEGALGEFKRWLREDYIRGGKFTAYVTSQVTKKSLSSETAARALAAYNLNAPALKKGA